MVSTQKVRYQRRPQAVPSATHASTRMVRTGNPSIHGIRSPPSLISSIFDPLSLKSGIPCPLPSPSGPVFYESKLIFSTFLLHASFLRFLQFLDRFLHPKGPPDPPLEADCPPLFFDLFSVLSRRARSDRPKTSQDRLQTSLRSPQDPPR